MDLRRTVLDASVELIAKEGIAALSMREIARRAGVSHAAPYHHFPDRAAILAAIAEEGFEVLGAELRAAVDDLSEPLERFRECGRAYVAFALAHPAHFRVMLRPELADPAQHPRIDAASQRTFQVLVECVVACQAAGVAPAGDPTALVITCWATAHGLAVLWLDGPLSRGTTVGVTGGAKAVTELVAQTLGDLLASGGRARSQPSPKRTGAARAKTQRRR